jgi:P27 family predicted phage terminase small subunit
MTRGRKNRILALDGALSRVPSVPDNMPEKGAVEWRKVLGILVSQAKIASHELAIVDAYCRIVARISDCEAAIAEHGLTLISPSGEVKRRPETTILKECHATLARLAGELGLTPASRAKNKGGSSVDTEDDDLAGL